MYAAFSEHAHNAELPRDDGESLLCFFPLLPGVHTTVSCPDGNEQ